MLADFRSNGGATVLFMTLGTGAVGYVSFLFNQYSLIERGHLRSTKDCNMAHFHLLKNPCLSYRTR